MKHLFYLLLLCAVAISCTKEIKPKQSRRSTEIPFTLQSGTMPPTFSSTSKSNPAGDGGICYNLSGTDWVHLAAPGNNFVWSATTSNYVWDDFTQAIALDISTLDVGANQPAPFVVGTDNQIWTTSDYTDPAYTDTWAAASANITRLSVRVNDGALVSSTTYPYIVWAIGADDNFVLYSGLRNSSGTWFQGTWNALSGGAEALDVDALYNTTTYIAGLDHKAYYRSGSSWVEFSGSAACKRIAVDVYNGVVWIIGTNSRVYYRNGSSWTEYPGNALAVDVFAANGVPFIIGTNGYVYQGNGSGWTQRN